MPCFFFLSQFNAVALSGVIIELTAICKAFAEKLASRSSTDIAGMTSKSMMPHMSDTLLFQITRTFRKRLFKIWEKIIESDRITISNTTLQQQQGGENHITSTSLQSDKQMDVMDETAPYMKYIEALSFRVPAPVVSAGESCCAYMPVMCAMIMIMSFGLGHIAR